MAKFNLRQFNIFTKNKEQHKAYSMDIKDRLITEVLTSLFNEDKYYGDNSKKIIEDIRNVLKTDPKFIANLAVYTRREMHLRSISHVLTGELAKSEDGKVYTRRVIKRIVQRPDDMSEILAYYINSFGKPIPIIQSCIH